MKKIGSRERYEDTQLRKITVKITGSTVYENNLQKLGDVPEKIKYF